MKDVMEGVRAAAEGLSDHDADPVQLQVQLRAACTLFIAGLACEQGGGRACVCVCACACDCVCVYVCT